MDMKNKILLWLPRILAILFTLFLVLFSFDVFDLQLPLWQKIGAFLIHSLPSIILGVVVFLSWKRPLIGGIVFILAGLAYILLLLTSPGLAWYLALSWSMTLAGPALLVGGLFLWQWKKLKKY